MILPPIQANLMDDWWLAIQDRVMAGNANFLENLYKEIYINFFKDNRWLSYLKGMGVTLEVSLFSALIGVLLGSLLALMRLSKGKVLGFNPLAKLSGWYIGLIRGTPMLLQVLIINFGIFGSVMIDKVLVGIIACGLNSAAYVAEIIRAGILSVDKGQTEAGRSLGLSAFQTMRLVILPQAVKTALPSLCNEFIVLIKETSILAYIALTDLTKAADYIRSRSFSAFTPYVISGAMYLIVTSLLSKGLSVLERRLRQGDSH